MEVWIEVIESYTDIRVWIAQNKFIPNEIMEVLSEDSSERVRWMIASINRLPEHLQIKMAKDHDLKLRQPPILVGVSVNVMQDLTEWDY
ncbi:hypothetical protein NQ117_02795 [Paenibacillus sp. SC116]|uniref:hypothetical protein n=1 Tax=Paenibacillus sp. SC116 TaxID=2968986 RepID=UPI00215B0548|nr:hypothetical protein [Paenibacillus sp. SC116]MCR8842598.1 hypothetical protein [Paenibacillus sp. SC116]